MSTPAGGEALLRILDSFGSSHAESSARPALHPIDPRALPGDAPETLWRYKQSFPHKLSTHVISMGEGVVPLERHSIGGVRAPCWFLRDDLEPTGSSKDRSMTLLISAIAGAGYPELVDDSTGNAALSLARYAQQASVRYVSYMPSSSRDARKTLVRRAGARVIEVPGTAADAAREAAGAAGRGAFWASDSRLPFDSYGAATAAFNIVEKLEEMPGAVLLPVGHGSLLSGLCRGFESMVAAGVGTMPLLIGVQSTACCPLARAWSDGLHAAPPCPAPPENAVAESVLIAEPRRAAEAIEAARLSGGAIAAVDDLALDRAVRSLWLAGVAIEPSAALGLAFLMDEAVQQTLSGRGKIVIVLTGHGMRDGLSLCAGF